MERQIGCDSAIAAPAAHAPLRPLASGPMFIDGIERRVCSLALQYWREVAGPRRYPTPAQITRESAPELWDHFFIVAVGADPADYTFVRSGPVLARALGFDPSGQKVGEAMPRETVGRALYYQKAACDLMAPIDDAGRWQRPDGGMTLYRTVLMPLSEDQRVATHILGAFSFRVVDLS